MDAQLTQQAIHISNKAVAATENGESTTTVVSYTSGAGLFTLAWFAENYTAIEAIAMSIGAVVVVLTFVVNWYYRHKAHTN